MKIDESDSFPILLLEEDDVILEPTDYFIYYGVEYPYWGSLRGRYRTSDYELGKFNRYAKLGNIAEEIEKKLIIMIKNDKNSIRGRCAYACLLMMKYGIRVGNEDSAEGYMSGLKKNKGEVVYTYGATTLLNKHIHFTDGYMLLDFLGKEQVHNEIKINDPFLIEIGKYYYTELRRTDKWLRINYEVLFDFVKTEIGEFVPKDLRTFCANITGWRYISKYLDKPKHEKKSDAKKEIKAIVYHVSQVLNNTPGVAKRNYLDARMLDWFLSKRIIETIEEGLGKRLLQAGILTTAALMGSTGCSTPKKPKPKPQPQPQIISRQSLNLEEVADFVAKFESPNGKSIPLMYYDTATPPRPTIGHGFNLARQGARETIESIGLNYDNLLSRKAALSDEDAKRLLLIDVRNAYYVAITFINNFSEHPIDIQKIIIDLAYNLGQGKLNEFKKFKNAINNKDYINAANELIDSRWYRQTGNRARHHVAVLNSIGNIKK